MHTRDQLYAISVYERVKAVKSKFDKDYRKYGVMCHKLPMLIHTAGLAQALAFVESRSKDKDKNDVYKQLIADLTETLKSPQSENKELIVPLIEEKNIVQQAREAHLTDYMRLTQQVMDALVWYKRCAQSILGVDASESDEQEGA